MPVAHFLLTSREPGDPLPLLREDAADYWRRTETLRDRGRAPGDGALALLWSPPPDCGGAGPVCSLPPSDPGEPCAHTHGLSGNHT